MSDRTNKEPRDSRVNSLNSVAENKPLFVVGIGASAGGLSALEELFGNLSTTSGAAFVVIQHLSPDFKSLMKELLERRTSMAVHRVTEGMELQPNSVYLIPPGQNLALETNILRLESRPVDKNNKHELNFPIDLFFQSLAKNFGERSVGVILSGSGSDGTRGLKAISEAGGVALVQDPETAEFDGMPNSAIATGIVHQVLPPRELSQLIYQCVTTPLHFLESTTETESSQSSNSLISNANLNRISRILLDEENLDFSAYKASTVSRRIHRRCLINNLENIEDYIALLLESQSEKQILCSDLLINVTHFFRDHPAWQTLENNILPRIIEQSETETELRFWITACSTGEEAYSLAILVHEALLESERDFKVKIFATDIDRSALEKASQGIYPPSIATDIDPERLQRYFVVKDNCYQVVRKIREMLIFSPHDLTKDAGFTKINLIACRNVLICMKSNLQYQVLRNLHFSLVNQGILFLGEAETLGEFDSEFNTLDQKWKFFQKRRDVRLPLPLRSSLKFNRSSSTRFAQPQSRYQLEPILEQCLNRLSSESDFIILLVGKDNHLLHVSGDSSKIFKAPDGKITTEVTKMVVPPLSLPLNMALHRARQQGKPVVYQGIKLEYQAEIYDVILEVLPPPLNRKQGDFFLVKIKEAKAIEPPEVVEIDSQELGSEASQRIMELETELQQTRENLQALVEELETTNEEQQASNEELTASNEELQSTNEELHSVNEELHTVNIEYQAKIGELTQLNDDVDNLLQSTEIGVLFLDSELKIRKFTPAIRTVIALRQNDLNRPLEDLYWKFDCSNLLDLLREVLITKQSQELEVKLKQSESYFLMQVHLYQTENQASDGLVISFIQIDELKQVQQNLQEEIVARKKSAAELKITQQQLERRVTERTESLARFSDRLEQLHRLATSQYNQLEDLLADYLQTGCEMFGLSTGIISRVTDGVYRIVAVESSLEQLAVGYETPCQNTYCAEVVEKSQTVAYAEVGKISAMQDHPVYCDLKLESFIGTPIWIDGELFGTLNFSDLQPKACEFREAEIKIIEIMARDIGNLIASDRSVKALARSNARFRSTFEQAAVGMAHVAPEGRFIKVNQRFCQIVAYEADVLLRKTFQEITHPEDLDTDLEYVRQVLAGEIPNYTMEKRYLRSDNAPVWINLTVSLVKDELGQPEYFIGVIEDISDRKSTEIALAESRSKLQQANQAKDKFISHMSHELRTPLNSVIGFSQLLNRDSSLTPQQLKLTGIIYQSGQHLLTLINDILDLSKLTANKLDIKQQEIPLRSLLQEVTTIFQVCAQEKNLTFSSKVTSDLPEFVLGDETRLRQVLLNLLSNAFKFTKEGTVTLEVYLLDGTSQVVRFQVEDTGIGIPEAEYATILAPFGQVEQNISDIQGTGLGLPICQNILELMNSKLNFTSKVGSGSCFWFDLSFEPVATSPVLPPALTELADATPKIEVLAQPCKILVVDDNQDNRDLLIHYLEPLGFTLQEAENGQAGIAIAEEFQPDAILIDLLMPVMDGATMLQNLQQHPQLKDTLAIVVSANSASILDSSQVDCDGFLAKPVNLPDLLELLSQKLNLVWQPLTQDVDLAVPVVPTLEQLTPLLEFVQTGDIDSLVQQTNSLAETNTQYAKFATQIGQLAEQCQLDLLEKLLQDAIAKREQRS